MSKTITINKDWVIGLKKYMDRLRNSRDDFERSITSNSLLGYLDSLDLLVKEDE